MISALALGYRVLGHRPYLDAAKRAADFLLGAHVRQRTRAYCCGGFCDGEAAVSGFLDDYAFFAQAMLDLFEASFDPIYLIRSLDLARGGFGRFEDKEHGGFFSTVEDAGATCFYA